ncbi:uncharacterized protein NECHADRAFT_99851 [Fusarium vanettenii 77-13-4]|uniref:Uncharacterized protein n=1 Tax=Fusarium vanettenii (strain ATCC MYA-4622 / CBS 123669 / FGSC 9596 / NRRL 45880 / 77-13-4) TaxID=660122 RepID=C7ZLU6_FUSV7|nr:uncharacterized protein NECHADRAFT_99851 [Fusarium vanettenii 77-13-4]EEU35025.1 predicted protein [Fusarium vanettenii 77-13-4]
MKLSAISLGVVLASQASGFFFKPIPLPLFKPIPLWSIPIRGGIGGGGGGGGGSPPAPQSCPAPICPAPTCPAPSCPPPSCPPPSCPAPTCPMPVCPVPPNCAAVANCESNSGMSKMKNGLQPDKHHKVRLEEG